MIFTRSGTHAAQCAAECAAEARILNDILYLPAEIGELEEQEFFGIIRKAGNVQIVSVDRHRSAPIL